MIDKAVLKRLWNQVGLDLPEGVSHLAIDSMITIISIEKLLKLANACAEYGKSQAQEEIEELKEKVFQLNGEIVAVNFEKKILSESLEKCATGEWKDYPENKPEESRKLIIEYKDARCGDKNKIFTTIGYFNAGKWMLLSISSKNISNIEIKRFAEINTHSSNDQA